MNGKIEKQKKRETCTPRTDGVQYASIQTVRTEMPLV